MKSITKQSVGAEFGNDSMVPFPDSVGVSLREISLGWMEGCRGLVFRGLVFCLIICFGALGKASFAEARQAAEEAALISVMEDVRVSERGDVADISASAEGAEALAAADVSPSAGGGPSDGGGMPSSSGEIAGVPPAPSAQVSVPETSSLAPSSAAQSSVDNGGPAVVDVPSSVPAPSAPLSSPKKAVAPMDVSGGDQGQAQTKRMTKPEISPEDDSYYDSLPLPPSTALERKTAGPREVDPKLEPASKFVVVTKDADANGFEALLVSANRALSLGRYDAAIDLFDQLCRKNGRDRRALLGRAVAFQKAGRDEAARAAYDEFLKLDPDNREAQINRLGLVAKDYPAIALRQMLDLRKKWSGDAGLAAQIGLAQARLGNDQDALEYLGIAASLDASSASHVFNMAVVSDRLGNKDQAIKLYEQALQIDSVHGGGRSIPREVVYDRLSFLRNQ